MATAKSRPRIAIVHPWLPHYRVEFFERLRNALDEVGIDLAVEYGQPPTFALGRGDSGQLDWARPSRESTVRVRGRSLTLRKPSRTGLHADLTILEDGLRNLDTYIYLVARKLARRPTAFWGHGRTMDKRVSPAEAWAKRKLVTRADWWFAYTPGTADYLRSLGADPARTTAVGNTIDTDALQAAVGATQPAEVESIMNTHALRRGHTALYIGGLSPVKNLRLLLDAGALVHRVDPLFKVVVAGDGPDRGLVEAAAASNPWLVVLRPVFDPRGKAALAGACDFMALPGLVGLAAVDSFALELPAVAVSPWHQAPEFEYLHDGVNCLISTPTPAEYARSIERMVSEPGLLERLRRGCRTSVEMHSLDSMVANFVAGAQAALAVT